MDPAQFGLSTIPLEHAPYGVISPDALKGANSNKVAIVTGAAQGIGAAIAESLAKSGADVAILDLTLEKLATTKEACQSHGVKVEAFACDVTDAARIDEVFNEVEKSLGPIE